MASVCKRPGGRRNIQFTAADGSRKTLRLGKVSQKAAEGVRTRVEDLVGASITGYGVSPETSHWLAGLDARMTDKLAGVGLIPKREAATLGKFLDGYLDRRADVKPNTQTIYGHTKRNLITFFGPNRPLRTITVGDAKDWRVWLGTHEKLAANTVARRTGLAKQFFADALDRKLIMSNPFAKLPSRVRGTRDRHRFITRADTGKVLGACPNNTWRLIVALSRFGGLRCPSETLALRWEDVNWDQKRFLVRSCKTEHHEGHESRWVPIFPEIEPYLLQAFEEAADGAVYVVDRAEASPKAAGDDRSSAVNLRRRLGLIIKAAGVEAWPKLFHNLRSTRQTELEEHFPSHVVCGWLGNSVAVARDSYLQTTEEHFARAVQADGDTQAQEGEKALQKPTQYPAFSSHTESHGVTGQTGDSAFSGSKRDNTTQDDSENPLPLSKVGPPGLEPGTSSLSATRSGQLSYEPSLAPGDPAACGRGTTIQCNLALG